MRYLLVVPLLAFAVVTGCSISQDSTIAEAKVPEFHSMLDAGESRAIYAASAEDLKKVASEKDFVALLDAVHRKLGQVKTTARQKWFVNNTTSGTFVRLTYKTVFAEGDATEEFVYRIKNGEAVLAGYHVNSLALITK